MAMKLRAALRASAVLFENAATSAAFILNTVSAFLHSAGDLVDELDSDTNEPKKAADHTSPSSKSSAHLRTVTEAREGLS
jgi:hypothetical protein